MFAAGNNHELCAQATEVTPNSIWIWNSLDEVLTVGALRDANTLWPYSSRGPGQWAIQPNPKPDCVAPAFGRIMWNCAFQDMANGWGTSGASPQGAGLAALIASHKNAALPAEVINLIKSTCSPLPLPQVCSGQGTIDCKRALQMLAAGT